MTPDGSGEKTPSTSDAPAAKTAAGFHLPALFGDHMLLQRDRENAIWGHDAAGQGVTVTLDGHTRTTTAGADGRWQLLLPALPAGGPHTLTIQGSELRRLSDVLVGEVWLASGQSNMEFDLARANDAVPAIAAARPEMRLFTVAQRTSGEPQSDVTGAWQVATPETAPRFSAVGYFFAQKLYATLNVPVGVIHASWGGTPVEAWTSRQALAARPSTRPVAERYQATVSAEANAEYERRRAEWHDRAFCKDPGNSGLARGFAAAAFDDSRWKELVAPGYWQEQGLAINGAVWFRRAFTVPAGGAATDFELELGAVDDFDETFVNGAKVGGLGPEKPDAWATPRRYRVPKALLRAGRNVIAVRVFDHFGFGGFHGAPTEMRVFPAGRPDAAESLAGRWRYFVEWSVPFPADLLRQEPVPPPGPNNPHSPGVLFDGMIAPLVPYGVRGAIWYQGEANVGRAAEYRELLPALIADWRARFGTELAFYLVQLANFQQKSQVPEESAWAELRAAQAATAASVPGTGLAVAIDIGEGADIHPKNKRDVGLRLALVALAKTYGQKLEYAGPTFASLKREGPKLRVSFTHADGGLRLANASTKVRGFAVAGADRRFAWADATLDGSSVVLSSPAVKEPRFVRYGWADNPDVNLTNGSALPATPFEAETP
jgi:sialate O-acetylesterase